MKISNDNRIILRMHIIVLLMMICTTAGTIVFLLQLPSKWIFYTLLTLLMLILILNFNNLRIMMYEDSGEIITIKLFHPLENRIYCRTVEFPVQKLKDFGMRRTFRGYMMALTLESLRKKEIKREFRLIGFGRRQLDSIISSLEHTKEMNTNGH